MNILIVHNYYRWRGGEGVSLQMEAGALREAGHRVDLFTLDNAVDLGRVGRVRAAGRSIWSMAAYRAIRSEIRAMGADIVHVNNFFPLISPAVFAAARKEGVPSVQSLRNYRYFCPATSLFRDGRICTECPDEASLRPAVRYRCYRDSLPGTLSHCASVRLQRRMGWLPDAAIAISRFVRDRYAAQGWPEERIFLKPNTVWPVPEPGPGGEAFVLVGRLAEDKGLETVLAAWEHLQAAGDPIPRLRIVGEGPTREALERRVQQAGLGSAIRFEGKCTSAETLDHIGAARALLFPAVRYEPFGRPIIEAFARGTPVLASNIGGPGELVRHGETGFLLPPGDARALARQVRAVQQTDLASMRRACRQAFDAQFAPTDNAARLLDLYAVTARIANGTWVWRT